MAQLRQEMTRDADKQAQRIESACGSPSSLGQCMALVTSANLSLTNLMAGYEYANTEGKKMLVADLLSRQLDDVGKLYGSLATQHEAASVRELLGAAIAGSLQVAGMAGISISSKVGTYSLDELSRAATAMSGKNGLSAAGHSLTKHGSGQREGNNLFPAPAGNAAAINQQAQSIVDGILTAPGTMVINGYRGRFGNTVEYVAPDGRGIVFDSSGKFLFFREGKP